jgi:hypothetical protein
MEPTVTESSNQWVSAAQLALPTSFDRICECPQDQIEKGHAALEQASHRKLTEFYTIMGADESRTLRARLFFVAAMLLEQTTGNNHKREMIARIRELHRQNPLYPSVATVYRTVAPLKVWLGQKSGMDHIPSVGELKADRRRTVLLVEENLLGIVAECKTLRKFVEKYQSQNNPRSADDKSVESSKPTTAERTADDRPAVFLIRGNVTAAQREQLVAILGSGCQIFDLDPTQAKTASKWLTDRAKKG